MDADCVMIRNRETTQDHLVAWTAYGKRCGPVRTTIRRVAIVGTIALLLSALLLVTESAWLIRLPRGGTIAMY